MISLYQRNAELTQWALYIKHYSEVELIHIQFFLCYIQHCFICRPSDSTVPTDAGIEPTTVATGALAVRSDALTTRLDLKRTHKLVQITNASDNSFCAYIL